MSFNSISHAHARAGYRCYEGMIWYVSVDGDVKVCVSRLFGTIVARDKACKIVARVLAPPVDCDPSRGMHVFGGFNPPPRPLPISLPDELDDLSLLRRASLSSLPNPNPNPTPTLSFSHLGTTNPRPKIAFLFLTNTDLVHAPLWNRFFHSHDPFFNIYVHADPSAQITPPPGVFQGRFISAKTTRRASPSLISATRRLLATAIIDDPDNAFFALLSQHCVPLHSFDYVYNTLFVVRPTNKHSTSTSRKVKLKGYGGGEKRYKSFIEILDKEPVLWDRYNARGKNVMVPEVKFEEFRVGSQFFVLTRKHALMVIKDRKLWRKFKLPCLNKESCYPEEHYFPTLLSMEDPKGCTQFTLTRVNWTGSIDGHPHTYSPPEVSPELIYRLRVSNSSYSYLFARKFSPDCLDPLMEMADTVIFRD
ncbi:hypothetical protein Sjap_012544 [Stephania japonica]|uniref:Uncharacterized protein n=1 Tax=Stephania japonica TaxID=461633 RepID=A0AAP0IY61_9MAGN